MIPEIVPNSMTSLVGPIKLQSGVTGCVEEAEAHMQSTTAEPTASDPTEDGPWRGVPQSRMRPFVRRDHSFRTNTEGLHVLKCERIPLIIERPHAIDH